MNFKRFHVSRNLFDKDNADVYEHSTLGQTNTWVYSAESTGITLRIPCDANTQYTLSIGSTIGNTIFRLSEISTDDVPIEGGSGGIVCHTILNGGAINNFTFTTASDSKHILFQVNANVTTAAINTLMLNTGSQPLPYEPYSSEVWHDTPHYIHNTSTDTLTTLPATLYPNDTSITVGLKGNEEHSGTPTHDNPIMPQGCGDMTGNLFDAATAYGNLYNNGVVSGTTAYVCQVTNYFTDEQIGKQITISIKADKVAATRIYIVTNVSGTSHNSNSIYENNTGILQITVTPQSTSDYWKMSYGSNANNECIISNIMLNTGSTALPYQPYGYKIPISSAEQTTPVYLGEVETTRQIKKLVLTGEEAWYPKWRLTTGTYATMLIDDTEKIRDILLCTHFESQNYEQLYYGTVGICTVANENYLIAIRVPDTVASNDTEFKAYLAQQYANGTPVTVWYVLATEETGIVNEPLMKVGDYADTLSNVSIPVTAGGDTLSVGTTVQPSEVTVNYRGWHPVADVHKRNNGAWT